MQGVERGGDCACKASRSCVVGIRNGGHAAGAPPPAAAHWQVATRPVPAHMQVGSGGG